ncbi:22595_t:CDS:2 [Cetraspora pellucida]|uniref:22595_t:CDS:1 n=1 Tax=Cetraspora pellucida TaxID=1433469 RepID=A0A9N9A9E0_9GLOM|nr:22595_t:CDS:2 [Cetraspora pellucida]
MPENRHNKCLEIGFNKEQYDGTMKMWYYDIQGLTAGGFDPPTSGL